MNFETKFCIQGVEILIPFDYFKCNITRENVNFTAAHAIQLAIGMIMTVKVLASIFPIHSADSLKCSKLLLYSLGVKDDVVAMISA